MFRYASLLSLTLASGALAQTYSATYLPSNVPKQTEKGQSGTNQCGTKASQDSMCQNLYSTFLHWNTIHGLMILTPTVNSIDDWCLFAPPTPGPDSVIGNTERIEVAWCIKDGYGTRLIPDGAITGAHFVQTPDYVQITGVGDLTKMNIPAGDEGGELDPHGADGNGESASGSNGLSSPDDGCADKTQGRMQRGLTKGGRIFCAIRPTRGCHCASVTDPLGRRCQRWSCQGSSPERYYLT